MSLSEEERRIVVRLELEKAKRSLGQIDGLARLGYWDNIANRLYYALFHAVSALLVHDGHAVNTHKGAVAMFGQYYVKTGVFSLADGRLYSQAVPISPATPARCTRPPPKVYCCSLLCIACTDLQNCANVQGRWAESWPCCTPYSEYSVNSSVHLTHKLGS